MTVAVGQVPKKENPLEKVGTLVQAAGAMKGIMGGKGGDAGTKAEAASSAMKRRMEVLEKQRQAGEQGPSPY